MLTSPLSLASRPQRVLSTDPSSTLPDFPQVDGDTLQERPDLWSLIRTDEWGIRGSWPEPGIHLHLRCPDIRIVHCVAPICERHYHKTRGHPDQRLTRKGRISSYLCVPSR